MSAARPSSPRLLTVVLFLVLAATLPAQNLIVGTYNLRNDNSGDVKRGNGWSQRCPVIADLVRFHGFDLVGTQEAKANQLQDLGALLTDFAHFGVGRDDGKQGGEFSAIFYRQDTLTLLRSGNFWLSETPDRPSKGWDAQLPRICTWGAFEQKGTGFKFYVFNVHFDHIGVAARRHSAQLMLNQIKAIAGDAPAIFMGDLNVDRTNESYQLIQRSGYLADAFSRAKFRYALNGSFNSFDPNSFTESVIDHVFLTKEFAVKRHGILTDNYRQKASTEVKAAPPKDAPKELKFSAYVARMPSDHFPVLVELCRP